MRNEKYDVVVPLNGGWQPALLRIITWVYGGKVVISGQAGMGWDDRNNLWCFPLFSPISTIMPRIPRIAPNELCWLVVSDIIGC